MNKLNNNDRQIAELTLKIHKTIERIKSAFSIKTLFSGVRQKYKFYQPELYGIVCGLLVLNIWYLSSLAINKSIIPNNYEYILQLLIATLGAFSGAYAAFYYNQRKEYEKTQKGNKKALNDGLFTLLRQYNAIANLSITFTKYANVSSLAFDLGLMQPPQYDDLKQDYTNLSFLHDHENSQLLLEIMLEQERFEQAIRTIHLRNDFLKEYVMPTVVSFRKGYGKKMNQMDYIRELDIGTYDSALEMAKHMKLHINETKDSLDKCYKKLRQTAKLIFPHDSFIAK